MKNIKMLVAMLATGLTVVGAAVQGKFNKQIPADAFHLVRLPCRRRANTFHLAYFPCRCRDMFWFHLERGPSLFLPLDQLPLQDSHILIPQDHSNPRHDWAKLHADWILCSDPTAPGFIGYAVDDSGLDAVDRHIPPSPATIVSEPPVVGGQAGGPGGHHQVGLNLQAQGSTMITTVTTTGLLTLTIAPGQVTTIDGPYAAKSQVVITEPDTTVGTTATVTSTASSPSMTEADYGTSSSTDTGAVSTTSAGTTAPATTASAPRSSTDAAAATSSSDADISSTPDATSSDPAQSASPTSDNPNAASNCTAMNMLQKFIIFYSLLHFWDMPFFDRVF